MKKTLLTPVLVTLTVLVGTLVLPAVGLAVVCDNDGWCDPGETPGDCPNDCKLREVNVMETFNKIVDWLFAGLIAFAAIMIVIAAFSFVTASGNPETVAKARHFVIYALIGVIVALLARGLVVLVQMITR